MDIRFRLMGGQLLLLVLFIGFVATVVNGLVSDMLTTLERQAAIEDMNRALYAFEREEEAIRRMGRDYGSWDDAYAFMDSRDPEFLDANFSDPMFTENAIDVAYIFDAEGRSVWGKVLEPKNRRAISLTDLTFPKDELQMLLDQKDPQQGASGLYMTSRGPLVLAAVPVTTSHYEGPVRGTVLMGRFLTEQMVTEVAQRTRVSMALHALDRPADAEEAAAVARLAKGDRMVVLQSGSGAVRVYAPLRDAKGRSVLLLRTETPRVLLAAGAISGRLATSTVMMAGALMLFLFSFQINRMILRPLRQARERIHAAAEAGDMEHARDALRAIDRLLGQKTNK